jgi:hypothetical protein
MAEYWLGIIGGVLVSIPKALEYLEKLRLLMLDQMPERTLALAKHYGNGNMMLG